MGPSLAAHFQSTDGSEVCLWLEAHAVSNGKEQKISDARSSGFEPALLQLSTDPSLAL